MIRGHQQTRGTSDYTSSRARRLSRGRSVVPGVSARDGLVEIELFRIERGRIKTDVTELVIGTRGEKKNTFSFTQRPPRGGQERVVVGESRPRDFTDDRWQTDYLIIYYYI